MAQQPETGKGQGDPGRSPARLLRNPYLAILIIALLLVSFAQFCAWLINEWRAEQRRAGRPAAAPGDTAAQQPPDQLSPVAMAAAQTANDDEWQWREFRNPSVVREPITMMGETELPGWPRDVDGDGREELLMRIGGEPYALDPDTGWSLNSQRLPAELPDVSERDSGSRNFKPLAIWAKSHPPPEAVEASADAQDLADFSLQGDLRLGQYGNYEVYTCGFNEHLEQYRTSQESQTQAAEEALDEYGRTFLDVMEQFRDGVAGGCGNTTMVDYLSFHYRLDGCTPQQKSILATELLFRQTATRELIKVEWPPQYLEDCCPQLRVGTLDSLQLPGQPGPSILIKPFFCNHLLLLTATGELSHYETTDTISYKTVVLHGPEHDYIVMVFLTKALVYP